MSKPLTILALTGKLKLCIRPWNSPKICLISTESFVLKKIYRVNYIFSRYSLPCKSIYMKLRSVWLEEWKSWRIENRKGIDKWEDRRYFSFFHLCLIGVKKWRNEKNWVWINLLICPIKTKKWQTSKKKKKKNHPNLLKKKNDVLKNFKSS